MRVFIKDASKFRFLTAQGDWTPHFKAARAFPNKWAAVQHCADLKLAGVHMLMELEEPRRLHLMEIEYPAASPT